MGADGGGGSPAASEGSPVQKLRGGCRKLCECNICNFSGDEITECQDHYPDHPERFDEDEDIVIKRRIFFRENKRIRFERPYQNSFWRPKDVKLAGMKKNCDFCQKVVFDHSRNHHSFEMHSFEMHAI